MQRLATFDSPSEAAEALYEEFGVRIERQQANNYDASKSYARKSMAKGLIALYEETRKRFVQEVESIPIAQKAYRLRRLDENERKARRMGNLRLSNDTVRQAAREVGGQFERGADPASGAGELDRFFSALGGDDDYLASQGGGSDDV